MNGLRVGALIGAAVLFFSCSEDEVPDGFLCPTGLESCSESCVDTANDPANCGGCELACDSTEVCGNGTCSTQCPSGQSECDRQCVDLATSLGNCGECGNTCPSGEVCSQGACQTSCGGGLVECAGTCRDLDSDRANCGACGVTCPGGEVCVDGGCEVSCPGGQANCDGFCVDTDTDRANCGACGSDCAAGQICGGGTCAISCPDGQIACEGRCVNTSSDRNNCDACGVTCGDGEVCTDGTCQLSCGGTTPTACDGGCVNTDTDPEHCGGCGIVCGPGEACNMSTCAANCGPGLTDCNGACVDLTNNPDFCGACDVDCPTTPNTDPICVRSVCGLSCQPGFGDCNADIDADGCETNLEVEVNNCGGCGLGCELDNAAAGCADAQCTVVACDAGWDDCDADPATGCEQDVSDDEMNCGACGLSCTGSDRCLESVCSATGEDCSSAIPLGQGPGTYGWDASLNDYFGTKPSCLSAFVEVEGPDVVFTYTATVSGEARLSLEKSPQERHVFVASDAACGTTVPELACSTDFFSTNSGARFGVIAGTTYFVYFADTDEGSGPLPNPLEIELSETPCSVLTSSAAIALSPTHSSTTTSVSPTFEASFPGSIRSDVGIITIAGDLGTNLTFDLATAPDEVELLDEARVLRIDAGPYEPSERITVTWNGIESAVGCGPIAAPAWTVELPTPSCQPGQSGVVGTTQTILPTTISTFVKYYVEADDDPSGFLYVGNQGDLFQQPKAGGPNVEVPIPASQVGFAMHIDDDDIFTIQNTTTGTSAIVFRISTDGGTSFAPVDAVGFPRTPGDDIRGVSGDGQRIYLITHENSSVVDTEIWSFDPSRVPTTARLEGTFDEESECSGLTLDDDYFYTGCQSSEVVIRIDRATFDVTVVNRQWDISAQKNSLQAQDLDADGVADVLYVKSFDDESYYVCDPAGPVPAFSDVHFTTGGSNYGLGFDPVANRLWVHADGFQGDFTSID
ncbi:MAG: MXAN_6577-like cysteine-rich protein [Myxococcota bacterium]